MIHHAGTGQCARRGWRQFGEQPCGGARRRGEDHSVCDDHLGIARGTDDEAPATVLLLREFPDGGAGPHGHTGGADELLRQPFVGADRPAVDALSAGTTGYVALARTPFYLEAGGQVSDSGRLVNEATGASAAVEGLVRIQTGLPRAHRGRDWQIGRH